MRPSDESLQAFKDRLARARSQLLSREPFLGFLALELPTQIVESADHEVQTAATDGKQYWYSYLWCRQLTDPELVLVVAHEVAHVMFLHAVRREGRDSHLWNAAGDFAINGILLASTAKDGKLAGIAAMPVEVDATTGRSRTIGLHDPQFANLPAELIYEKLVKSGQAVGANWDQLLETNTGDEASVSVAQARAARAKALIRASEWRKRRGHGDQPGHWERWAEKEIHGTVRWQDRFRDRVLDWGDDIVSWSRPNRKYRPHGLYLPRHRGYRLPNILFAFDTSGSISDQFLGRMVGELNQLLLSAGGSIVRVVCCDAALHVIGDFSASNRLDPRIHSLRGGGGTDFRPVFDYASTHREFPHLVFLTDADGLFPESPPSNLHTLWLIPERSGVTVPFGEVISLPMSSLPLTL